MSNPNFGLGEQVSGSFLDFLQMTANAYAIAPASLPVVGANGLTINGTNIYYLKSFIPPRNVTYSWYVLFSSVGTIAATVELEQGFARPTTEGAPDAAWSVPDNKLTSNGLFQTIGDNSPHQTAYSPNATPFARIKITGTGSNNAATLITACKAYAIKNNLL